jgi:flagellar FliJ protein
MADLDPLIRLRRYTVDEKQKFLSALYREAENLINKRKALADQLEHEKELAKAEGSPDSISFFGRYAENVRKKLGKFDEHIKKMENRIEGAQEDMRAAFAELKKVEIIKQKRIEREQQAQDHKESRELDEIAIDGFRRKEE